MALDFLICYAISRARIYSSQVQVNLKPVENVGIISIQIWLTDFLLWNAISYLFDPQII